MVLKSNSFTSAKYHDIFDFKLTKVELVKWQYKNQKIKINKAWPTSLTKSRLERKKQSQKKLKIANSAASLISKIPSVKFVGITGSLAMMNSNRDSDIDLMIITSNGRLWTTRLLCYWSLVISHWSLRRPKVKKEKDMLCINLWLDESDLKWDLADRNIYTAHEIAQVVPLVNKDKTYEKFLYLNKWILDFWPNSVEVSSMQQVVGSTRKNILQNIIENIAFKIQYLYMKPKITREVVTPTRAIFHPNDWGKVVIDKLSS